MWYEQEVFEHQAVFLHAAGSLGMNEYLKRYELLNETDGWRSVSVLLCLARTWNGGKGGQCNSCPSPGGQFCKTHLKDERWKNHGSVRGPIPDKKLQEFLRVAAKRCESSGGAVASSGPLRRRSTEARASSEAKGPAAATDRKSQAGAFGAEEITAINQRVRRMLGTFNRTELLEMDAAALLKIIREKDWQGPKWDTLREGLKRGRLERESAERILEQQEAEVSDGVARELAAASRPPRREAERPARGAKRKAEGPGEAAPPAKGQRAAEGAAGTARPRAGGPAAKEGARAPREPKAPRCTCGCPIHQIRCPLFKPVYQPECDVKYSAATGVCSARPGTGRLGAPSAPPSPPALPRGAQAPRLSQQAADRVRSLAAEVAKLPVPQQRGEWKKKMLLYHPDKRQGQGKVTDTDRDFATQIFMEIKRKIDSMAEKRKGSARAQTAT
ncbi:unnamed protein product [Prorocentrum cordatum]|uniref:J domain-containing protein n=1 Tax=Prorocentrum cordatum TaxID=2364126 RepID=A0ABN9R3R0_9DINO|nr:unnamed protein product [Polarella glacialis]